MILVLLEEKGVVATGSSGKARVSSSKDKDGEEIKNPLDAAPAQPKFANPFVANFTAPASGSISSRGLFSARSQALRRSRSMGDDGDELSRYRIRICMANLGQLPIMAAEMIAFSQTSHLLPISTHLSHLTLHLVPRC